MEFIKSQIIKIHCYKKTINIWIENCKKKIVNNFRKIVHR